eukprot:TRINITY_DN26155_c0_g2_i1.p1 TRINITY_DN26155_c0_g2~~TRINITY_DN26155_c0_g2_i1.p1  ORF type:complete len:280 (-),score=56.82 TRINITY_DN26155_c0_g2_i1:181-1020(-)
MATTCWISLFSFLTLGSIPPPSSSVLPPLLPPTHLGGSIADAALPPQKQRSPQHHFQEAREKGGVVTDSGGANASTNTSGLFTFSSELQISSSTPESSPDSDLQVLASALTPRGSSGDNTTVATAVDMGVPSSLVQAPGVRHHFVVDRADVNFPNLMATAKLHRATEKKTRGLMRRHGRQEALLQPSPPWPPNPHDDDDTDVISEERGLRVLPDDVPVEAAWGPATEGRGIGSRNDTLAMPERGKRILPRGVNAAKAWGTTGDKEGGDDETEADLKSKK